MSGLAAVATRDLERLQRELQQGTLAAPLSRAKLAALRLGALWEALAGLGGLSGEGLLAVVTAVLAERGGTQGPKVELVWTGPEGRSAWSRPTGRVVRELFEGAQRSVILAGYSFDHGAQILEPLHAAMRDRGVAVALYLNVERAPHWERDLDSYAERALARFLAANWPFGAPYPVLHYDPRTLSPNSVESLHAKCIVVDEEQALIGSANFTDRGQSRNVEVGVVIEDASFARALASQWRSATAAGVFISWVRDGG